MILRGDFRQPLMSRNAVSMRVFVNAVLLSQTAACNGNRYHVTPVEDNDMTLPPGTLPLEAS